MPSSTFYLDGNQRGHHAESVRVLFDPSQVSYAQLLKVYFTVATDPTQLNRQSPDTGTQYRGLVFVNSPAQRQAAMDEVAKLTADHAFRRPIVTQIVLAPTFYPAEAYHQLYLDLNPGSFYIRLNDALKVRALAHTFPDLYVPTSVAAAGAGG